MKICQPDKELESFAPLLELLFLPLFSFFLSFSSHLLKEGGEKRGSDLGKQDKEGKRGWEEEERKKGERYGGAKKRN